LELDPNKIEAIANKGLTFKELGKFQEYLNCFNKVLELDPNNRTGWYNKGIALDKLEKQEEALKCLDTALKLDSNFEQAKKAKKKILSSIS